MQLGTCERCDCLFVHALKFRWFEIIQVHIYMLAFNLLAGTFPHEFFFNMRKYEALTMIVISARP